MTQSIKLALLDDETIFRTSLRLLLQSYRKDFDFVFEGGDGNEFIKYLESKDSIIPDILLLDIRMPNGMNGMEVITKLSKNYKSIQVIVLSSLDSNYFKDFMIKSGACGYITKNASPQKLLFTIKEVYDKGMCYEPEMIEYLLNKTKNLSTNLVKSPEQLSSREVEILELICQEFSNKQIADKLNISERTVEGHRRKMMAKTKSNNIAGLILFAIREQIIEIDLT